MPNPRLLIVDDDTTFKTALFRLVSKRNFNVITSSSMKEATSFCSSNLPLDLAIIDVDLSDGCGLNLMTSLQQQHPNLKFLILSSHATIELAIEATKKGATHFLPKPVEIEELLHIIFNLFPDSPTAPSNEIQNSISYQPTKPLYQKYEFDNIIGQSEEIHEVLKLIEKVSQSQSSVLITGESGTGKELVAKAIHYNSPRGSAPFVPLNCGAIPSELLESELFGHIKGAFTGSVANRTGRFELAKGGSIFFDEIGEMSPFLQVKLLRVLQEQKFEPVGGIKTISTDVRVISATNIDLEDAIRRKDFREDLFYRLNVIPIRIPALREHPSDIPLLIQHFLKKYKQKTKPSISGVTPEAMERLMAYSWPGNIRELENLIERLVILSGEGLIGVEDLPEKYVSCQNTSHFFPNQTEISGSGMDFNSAVDAYENSLILKALEKTNWNRNQAAILLKLNRTTLVEKIKKKGLKPKEVAQSARISLPAPPKMMDL